MVIGPQTFEQVLALLTEINERLIDAELRLARDILQPEPTQEEWDVLRGAVRQRITDRYERT